MQSESCIDELNQHRDAIDDLDVQIVALLNERASHSLAIRDLKPQLNMAIYDPKREEQILQKICSGNKGPLYDDNLREVYREILRVMKEAPSS